MFKRCVRVSNQRILLNEDDNVKPYTENTTIQGIRNGNTFESLGNGKILSVQCVKSLHDEGSVPIFLYGENLHCLGTDG